MLHPDEIKGEAKVVKKLLASNGLNYKLGHCIHFVCLNLGYKSFASYKAAFDKELHVAVRKLLHTPIKKAGSYYDDFGCLGKVEIGG